MMRGIDIDGVHVSPEEVTTLEEATRLRVVVKEGKKHEVSVYPQRYDVHFFPVNMAGLCEYLIASNSRDGALQECVRGTG
jgi:hypothetical protein